MSFSSFLSFGYKYRPVYLRECLSYLVKPRYDIVTISKIISLVTCVKQFCYIIWCQSVLYFVHGDCYIQGSNLSF